MRRKIPKEKDTDLSKWVTAVSCTAIDDNERLEWFVAPEKEPESFQKNSSTEAATVQEEEDASTPFTDGEVFSMRQLTPNEFRIVRKVRGRRACVICLLFFPHDSLSFFVLQAMRAPASKVVATCQVLYLSIRYNFVLLCTHDASYMSPSSQTGQRGTVVEVCGAEIRTLVHPRGLGADPSEMWLDDQIIEMALRLIVRKANVGIEEARVGMVSSFFFTRLTGAGYDYESVRRWTPRQGVDIGALEVLLVPVHHQEHWCLGVVRIKEKRVEVRAAIN